MEKTPLAGPLVFTTVGAAVRVSASVAPAALPTVMVPSFAVVPPVFIAGVGAENVTVAPVTVKVTVLLLPPGAGVTTVTVLPPRLAPDAMVNVAVTLVSLTAAKLLTVTLVPETVTAVAPVRPAPVSVTFTGVPPRTPEVGLMEAKNGPTVKFTALVVVPPTVTVTLRTLRVAVAEMVKVAVT